MIMTMMVMGTVPDEANGGDEDDWEKENAEQDGDEDVGEGGLQVHQQVIDHQNHKPSSFDRSWPTSIMRHHHQYYQKPSSSAGSDTETHCQY